MTIIFSLIIIFLSGLIQGITSFGFSLIAVPLLGLFLSLKIIVPLLIIFSFILNGIILYQLRSYINFKEIIILIIAAAIATPIGTNVLITIDESILKLLVGVIVLFSSIMFKFGLTVKIKNEKKAYFPVGFISGLLNGSVSLSGPPVILFLTNQKKNKQVFRATLTSFFFTLNIITIIVFMYNGLITPRVLKLSSVLLPGLIIGSLIGIKIGNHVKEKVFVNLTIVLIASMGILSIVSSFS